MKKKVGLIGCGTIGTGLARYIKTKLSARLSLAFLCDSNDNAARQLQKRYAPRAVRVSFDELLKKSDLIIEAATGSVVPQLVRKGLRTHKTILVMSIGGLLALKDLPALIKKTSGELLLPSGAIAGLDAVAAARQATLTRVRITTAKPVAGLRGAPYFEKKGIDLSRIKKPTIVFEGNALQAIRHFPKNINVAALLSVAAGGPRKVAVRIITSPAFTRNTHTVEIEGSFGKATMTTENLPSPDNPKTSYLAILSACAMLEKTITPMKIGV